MGKALCFTGHRPDRLPFGENELDARCIQLKALLLNEIMMRAEAGYDTFYCGAAAGADLIFGQQVLLVKITGYPNIRLICAIPHPGQASRWSAESKRRYAELLDRADEKIVISETCTPECYYERNRFMVDRSDAVLSVYSGGETGGTAYTIRYAHEQGKEIVSINPETLELTQIPAKTIQ